MTTTKIFDREIALQKRVAELEKEVARLEPLQFRQAPCHKFCESTAFNIEIRNLKRQLAEALIEASRKQEAVGEQIRVAIASDTGWSAWREFTEEDIERKYHQGVETRYIYAAPVVAPDVHYAGLLKVMKDIVQLWDHHCYEHGDGIPSPLHCRAKEAIAAMGVAND